MRIMVLNDGLMHAETWYQWKEVAEVDGEPRYLTPWRDAFSHEYPMDLLFRSPEAARDYVEEQEIEAWAKDWVLIKVTYELATEEE